MSFTRPQSPSPSLRQVRHQIPVRYRHQSALGKRLPGWEMLNVERLAKDLEVTPGHLRAVLTERRGASYQLLAKMSEMLKTGTIGVLLDLMKRAARVDEKRRRG